MAGRGRQARAAHRLSSEPSTRTQSCRLPTYLLASMVRRAQPLASLSVVQRPAPNRTGPDAGPVSWVGH